MKTNAFKMFQVTDGNHSAWLVLAQSERHAIERVLKANPDVAEQFDEDDEGPATAESDELKEWRKNKGLEAQELKDLVFIDNDGPISFY